jgi:hypothetical protein
VPTADNLADMLTKTLPCETLVKSRGEIRVLPREQSARRVESERDH